MQQGGQIAVANSCALNAFGNRPAPPGMNKSVPQWHGYYPPTPPSAPRQALPPPGVTVNRPPTTVPTPMKSSPATVNPYSDCGPSNTRGGSSSNYRPRNCTKFFTTGTCSFGQNCRFSHEVDRVSPPITYVPGLKSFDHRGRIVSHWCVLLVCSLSFACHSSISIGMMNSYGGKGGIKQHQIRIETDTNNRKEPTIEPKLPANAKQRSLRYE